MKPLPMIAEKACGVRIRFEVDNGLNMFG